MVDAVPRSGSPAASLAWEQRNDGSVTATGRPQSSRRTGSATRSPSRTSRRTRTRRDAGSASTGARSSDGQRVGRRHRPHGGLQPPGHVQPAIAEQHRQRPTVVGPQLADGAGPPCQHRVVVDRLDRLRVHQTRPATAGRASTGTAGRARRSPRRASTSSIDARRVRQVCAQQVGEPRRILSPADGQRLVERLVLLQRTPDLGEDVAPRGHVHAHRQMTGEHRSGRRGVGRSRRACRCSRPDPRPPRAVRARVRPEPRGPPSACDRTPGARRRRADRHATRAPGRPGA